MKSADRILVTGATGFIGGRLVEALAERGVRIRVATSDFRNCARVARFPVELVKADLRDRSALVSAAVGCDVIFHCAYKFGGPLQAQMSANLDGTRALAEAFIENGGRRFVHISSVAAYGRPRNGELHEGLTPERTDSAYSNTKIKLEHLLRGLHRSRGLPVVIMQPTIVYGPYGSTWTTRLLEQVRSRRIALPSRGSGFCNAVYVDDVVAAMLLAAENDTAIGETFLISGSAPTTWREFYRAYERMIGEQVVLDLDDEQISNEERRERRRFSLYSRMCRELARRPHVRKYLLTLPPQKWLVAIARFVPDDIRATFDARVRLFWERACSQPSFPLYIPDRETRMLFAARTRVRIDKARKVLGYEPRFNLERGMELTGEWARWANLLPAEPLRGIN
jgi:nucleoside-diphosphate-sugar epimerase